MKQQRLWPMAGVVNHATKNNTVEITVSPYLAGTVNHGTMDEAVKNTEDC